MKLTEIDFDGEWTLLKLGRKALSFSLEEEIYAKVDSAISKQIKIPIFNHIFLKIYRICNDVDFSRKI